MRDTAWGALLLLSTEDRAPGGDTARSLDTVSLLFDAAVAQAALRTETEQKSRRLESLTRLAQTLTGTLALEEVLQRVVDAGVWIFHSSTARLWPGGGHGRPVLPRATPRPPPALRGGARVPRR